MPIIKEDPFHKYDPTHVNFSKVKGEVEGAMKYDWKRDKVDDAKKRAITTAATYDDFKARVAGCTLKPIHRNEFNAPPKFAFNRQIGAAPATAAGLPGTASAAGTIGGSSGARLAATASEQGGVGKLRNSRELEREFRRCASVEEKVALLSQIDGDACVRFFSKDLDAELLRHMLLALDEAAAAAVGPRNLARQLLGALAARCPTPLQTASTFLMASDKAVAARLLALDEASEAGEDVRICAALGMPPSSIAMAAAERKQASVDSLAAEGTAGSQTGAGSSFGDSMD